MSNPTTLDIIYNAVLTYVEGHTGVRYLPPFPTNYSKMNDFCSINKDNKLYMAFDKVEVKGQFSLCMKEIGLTLIVQLPENLPEEMKKSPYSYMSEIIIPPNENTDNVFVDASFRWYHHGGGSNGHSVYFLFKDGNIFNVRLG